MKYIIFLITPLIFSSTKKTKYVILYNQNISTGVPVTEDRFWDDSVHFDTITVQGERIIPVLEKEISRFEKIKAASMTNKWFSVNNALIRYSGAIAVDTIYASRDFGYWKINGQLFEDKRKFFIKRFSQLSSQ